MRWLGMAGDPESRVGRTKNGDTEEWPGRGVDLTKGLPTGDFTKFYYVPAFIKCNPDRYPALYARRDPRLGEACRCDEGVPGVGVEGGGAVG